MTVGMSLISSGIKWEISPILSVIKYSLTPSSKSKFCAYNKQFKRDSQRLAFLLLLQIKCLWHNALGLGGGVAHPLIGRYVNGAHLENISSQKW